MESFRSSWVERDFVRHQRIDEGPRGWQLPMTPPSNARQEVNSLGYHVRYVPHETIGEQVACYHVVYEGQTVKPKAAEALGIPLSEIWISESYRDREESVLYHELREIQYRARGWKASRAHRQATKDEESAYGPRLW